MGTKPDRQERHKPPWRRIAFLGPDQVELDEGPRVRFDEQRRMTHFRVARPSPFQASARSQKMASAEARSGRLSFPGKQENSDREVQGQQAGNDGLLFLQSLGLASRNRIQSAALPPEQAPIKSLRSKHVSQVRMLARTPSDPKQSSPSFEGTPVADQRQVGGAGAAGTRSFDMTPSTGSWAGGGRPMSSPRQVGGDPGSFERTSSGGCRPMSPPRG